MKLNWFSPLPPAKTGIAECTAGLLPTLAKHAHVTVWTDQREYDSQLDRHCLVRQFDPKRMNWPIVNEADVTFYNMGNNHLFHASIWQVSRLHPGVVILHDVSLHNFFDSLYNGVWHDTAGYLDHMTSHYGLEGREAAHQFAKERTLNIEVMAERYPLTPLALENALAAIVHSPGAFDQFRKENQIAAAYAPLPAVFGTRPNLEQLQQRKPGPPYNLIVFGHLGRNRRLDSVLQALAGLSQRHLFHLNIYGSSNDPKLLRERVRSLKLSEAVTIHGYAAERELNEALMKAHLAINLRYPTMGEASASQLRIWSYALPSLVTRVGWYGSLSEQTVAHIRPDREVEDIQAQLSSLVSGPETFEQMGRSGYEALVKKHDPEVYARTVLEIGEHVQQLHARAAAKEMARRAGQLVSSWSNDSTSESLRIAEQIVALTGDYSKGSRWAKSRPIFGRKNKGQH